jgi:hypothetical protein
MCLRADTNPVDRDKGFSSPKHLIMERGYPIRDLENSIKDVMDIFRPVNGMNNLPDAMMDMAISNAWKTQLEEI